MIEELQVVKKRGRPPKRNPDYIPVRITKFADLILELSALCAIDKDKLIDALIDTI